MLRPNRTLRLVQTFALAMILVVAGLVNGIQAHVALDHHASGSIGLNAIVHDHGHSHDDSEVEGVGAGDETSGAPHDTVHHHVTDALLAWSSAVTGPGCESARSASSKPPPADWASWPPHRPPCDCLVS